MLVIVINLAVLLIVAGCIFYMGYVCGEEEGEYKGYLKAQEEGEGTSCCSCTCRHGCED